MLTEFSTEPIKGQIEYSVTELSQLLKSTIEDIFTNVRIRGEISGLKRAASGHVYFNLKDDKSVINCVCWRGLYDALKIKFEEGMEVICSGKISIYAGRSNYQLIISSAEHAGVGALLATLEARKKKLQAEGLFDKARKSKIPFLPLKVGIITSPTGAVIQDVLHRLTERFPINVKLWGTLVQGKEASLQIITAIKGFNNLEGADKPEVLIIARGGGSVEDLWCFNDEDLVRAIASSKIPVISAVGHETDFTLADYVADLRAPTPTAAAEVLVPVKQELEVKIDQDFSRITHALTKLLENKRHQLQHTSLRLNNFINSLNQSLSKIEKKSVSLVHAFDKLLNHKTQKVNNCKNLLNNFVRKIDLYNLKLQNISITLPKSVVSYLNHKAHLVGFSKEKLKPSLLVKTLQDKENLISTKGRLLNSYSYQKTLERGFAIIKDSSSAVVKSASGIQPEKEYSVMLKDGEARVKGA